MTATWQLAPDVVCCQLASSVDDDGVPYPMQTWLVSARRPR
jgi:hypothetical protein